MCKFCEECWDDKNKVYTVKNLSERTESKYNEACYTGIQTFIDLETNELTVIACLDNKHIKPILKFEGIKIKFCPICGRELGEV